MNIKLLVSIFLLNFISCSTTNESGVKQATQKWQLVKTTGSFMGSETMGNAMAWQESYELKTNGTFIKSRIENGLLTKASGTYKFLDLSDGKYLELTYPSNSSLIGNCTGDLKETLWVISGTEMRGTWLACDGPGLEYELVK